MTSKEQIMKMAREVSRDVDDIDQAEVTTSVTYALVKAVRDLSSLVQMLCEEDLK
jgi:hypothetical protein